MKRYTVYLWGKNVEWTVGWQHMKDICCAYEYLREPIKRSFDVNASNDDNLERLRELKKTSAPLIIFGVVVPQQPTFLGLGDVVGVRRPSEKDLLYKSGLVLDVDGVSSEALVVLKSLVSDFATRYNKCAYLYTPSTTDNIEGNIRKGHFYFLLDEKNFVSCEDYKECMSALEFFIFKDKYTKKDLKELFNFDWCGDKICQGFFKTIIPSHKKSVYYRECYRHYLYNNPPLDTKKLLGDYRKHKQEHPEEVKKFFGDDFDIIENKKKSVCNNAALGAEEGYQKRATSNVVNTQYEIKNPVAMAFRDMNISTAIAVVEHLGYVFKRYISPDRVEFDKPGASSEGGVFLQRDNNWLLKSFHQNTEEYQRGDTLWKFFVRKVNKIPDSKLDVLTFEDWGAAYAKARDYIVENNLIEKFSCDKVLKKYCIPSRNPKGL